MPNVTEELALCLGHELVARAHYHVDRLQAFHAIGHGGQGVYSTHAEDFVCAGGGHGIERGWIHALALNRWRQATTRETPATLGVITVMWAEASMG